jgi:hypothetical protein
MGALRAALSRSDGLSEASTTSRGLARPTQFRLTAAFVKHSQAAEDHSAEWLGLQPSLVRLRCRVLKHFRSSQ